MKQHDMADQAEPVIDDANPPPRFPTTFDDANLTLRCLAGVAFYLGGVVEHLHRLPENATECDWDQVRYCAAEAECRLAEGLQRLARSERPNTWLRRERAKVQP